MVARDKPPKEKRRNNEKRKEKSRDAARCRRSRETEIFTDLANVLPLNQEQVAQLDKASIMRLGIAYLRVRDMVKLVPQLPQIAAEDAASASQLQIDTSTFLQSLEGFLLVLSADGDFIYTSENVADYLGIAQIDLMGQNIYEYSHPCDHDEIREILSTKGKSDDTDTPKSFFIRLKCTLTSKGRSVNLKSATYKVIHCNGHIARSEIKRENGDEKNCVQSCLVAVGKRIPHPSNIEDPLPKQTFITKHGLDMKFTHADDQILEDILGYTAQDLVGKSVFEYHHAMDSDSIGSAYKCLFSKGQSETNRYRFLAKRGGYVWVVTQATLIHDKVQKPQSVVCVNYVISGVECADEIYSSQQEQQQPETSVVVVAEEQCVPQAVPDKLLEEQHLETEEEVKEVRKPVAVTESLFASYVPRAATATTKIFAPRTEDMSKGFLTFSEDEPGLTMLKDEPDDLTHLAPYAPLNDDNPFLSEMLDDILLRGDNFGPLLSEAPADPFIAYRDFADSTPELLSPNKNSDGGSLPSLNSPTTDSLGEEEHMSTFMQLQVDDEDLALKAPYIPMNMADDLPLLMADDLMWTGAGKAIPDNNSSLAQLLSASVNKPTDHGGGLITTTTRTQQQQLQKNKRSHDYTAATAPASKRIKTERSTVGQKPATGKMSSELLQQLMASNHSRGRAKGKSNWLLDAGGARKAACVSQPSDSVLMNLLEDDMELDDPVEPTSTTKTIEGARDRLILLAAADIERRRTLLRKRAMSLINPDGSMSPLRELTQQDYEVNAPVNSLLLGQELLSALDGRPM